jgi:hypothetical protein
LSSFFWILEFILEFLASAGVASTKGAAAIAIAVEPARIIRTLRISISPSFGPALSSIEKIVTIFCRTGFRCGHRRLAKSLIRAAGGSLRGAMARNPGRLKAKGNYA